MIVKKSPVSIPTPTKNFRLAIYLAASSDIPGNFNLVKSLSLVPKYFSLSFQYFDHPVLIRKPLDDEY